MNNTGVFNKIEKIDQPDNLPIKSGEVFDPTGEFAKLKKYHGQEGLDQVAIFKEKLKYQKEGMAAIETKVVDYLREHQNLNLKEMEELVAADLDIYGFPSETREKIAGFLKEIIKRSETIKQTIADCLDEKGELDSKKLFTKLFNRPPVGEMKIEHGNLCINFRFKDDEDFTYVASGAYKRKRATNDRDREIAQSTGGQSLSDYPKVKLRGLIMIETPDYYDDDFAHKTTRLHEEQHAFNFLWKDFELSDYVVGLKKMAVLRKSSGDKLSEEQMTEWAIMLVRNNPRIEANIKDEISAYFKGNIKEEAISEELLLPDTIYEYGAKYNLLDVDESDGTLSYRYMRMVEKGILAFACLLDAGYSYEAVHAILYTEPLVYWLRVANRMTGEKIDFTAFQELEKKYISPKIIQQIQDTKQFEADLVTDSE